MERPSSWNAWNNNARVASGGKLISPAAESLPVQRPIDRQLQAGRNLRARCFPKLIAQRKLRPEPVRQPAHFRRRGLVIPRSASRQEEAGVRMLAVIYLYGSLLPTWFVADPVRSLVEKAHPLLFPPAEILVAGLRNHHRLNRQALQTAIGRGHLSQQQDRIHILPILTTPKSLCSRRRREP